MRASECVLRRRFRLNWARGYDHPVSYFQWPQGAVVIERLHWEGITCQYAVFALLKAMTLVTYFYDRDHLHPVSLLDLIELESEHKNTTSAELPRRP